VTIVALEKVTFCGHVDDRRQILTDLQELGCLHLIAINPEKDNLGPSGSTSRAREALRFLTTCSHRRWQVTRVNQFDAADIEVRALKIKDRIGELEHERDFLMARIENLSPWGAFDFPRPEALNTLRMWFYIVPHKDMGKVRESGLVWERVFAYTRFSYVVVISTNEPEGMPVERVRTGNRTLHQLEERLEEVELALEDLFAERAGLTRWCTLFARDIERLEDQAAVVDAIGKTYAEDAVFALQAWAPKKNIPQLQEYAHDHQMVFEAVPPEAHETPPTLMANPKAVAGGQDLVSFYTTPQYWLWDPSTIVFFSFAVFFAMIFADAGYSAILGLVMLGFWKKMGRAETGRRLRILLATMVGAGIFYGVMVGSYFGVSPEQGSVPARLKIIDMMDFDFMMQMSILLGVFHLVLANGVSAWNFRRSMKGLKPLAWAVVIAGGTLIWQGASHEKSLSALRMPGFILLGLGLSGVLLFTGTEGPVWKRLLKGFTGLTGISSVFSDALSYLRLFALGLASASLAGTFNAMAGQVKETLPGIGVIFALLIALLGHTLNFFLAVAGGFIHGLRLNFIEFFRWSITEEGYPFRAFDRKEKKSWKT
jgi:V/A-type H+-transporting ATPase subunit I